MDSTGKKNIYETIALVMADIGAVGKNSKNMQQNFMFRGIDAVMNAVNPAMIKHRLFVIPEILEQTREERTTQKGALLIYSICKIRYTFYAEDGSSVSAVTIGEGMDSGDKATNKAMAIAFKYALFQVFCIPTEELRDSDPDRECHETAPRNQGSAGSKTPVSEGTKARLQAELERTGKTLNVAIDSMSEAYAIRTINELRKLPNGGFNG